MFGLVRASARRGRRFGLPAQLPPYWEVTRFAGNPIIEVADNPHETTEQYNPGPILLPNGEIWLYVKGTSRVYAWKSTDGGETFTLENSTNAVLTPGTSGAWDDSFVVEPFAVYDEPSDTIHLWYGGRNTAGDSAWAWGHATAPGSSPITLTKDAANPILTSAEVSADLGGAAMADLKLDDVVVIDGEFHFFGYALYNGVYRLIRCTGTTWNDPSGAEILFSAPGGAFPVVHSPSVFRWPGQAKPRYGMLYSIGGAQFSNPRWIRVALSDDGQAWTFPESTMMSPVGSAWESVEVYSGAVLKESQSPYDLPVRDASGRWRFYYSGLNGSQLSQTGLAYIKPRMP